MSCTMRENAMRHAFLIVAALLSTAPVAKAGDNDDVDRSAIKQAALDYIEGWYEGNAERMERALHPELAKRIVVTDPKTGRSRLNQMSAMTLVQSTRAGYGRKTPPDQQRKDVTILDRFNDMATVKVVAAEFVDYLHIAKYDGKWKIVNVLWTLTPKDK